MKRMAAAILVVACLALIGACASTMKGAAIGAGVGAIAGNTGKGMAAGAAVGAAVDIIK